MSLSSLIEEDNQQTPDFLVSRWKVYL